jgi:hypothetical protein
MAILSKEVEKEDKSVSKVLRSFIKNYVLSKENKNLSK